MKIVADENIPYVKDAFGKLGLVYTMSGRLIKNVDLKDAEVLLVRSITEVNKELLQDTAIKFVASATSGINHIDLPYLKKQNIAFAHALGSNAQSVVQYVASAICHWSKLVNRPLNTLKIGIIGYGNVGSKLKTFCDMVGIETTINDPPLAESNASLDIEHFASLDDVLNCDIISVHVPLTVAGKHATNYLINYQQLKQLKPMSLFINAARGGVVNEEALLAHKNFTPEFNIVLDVWENEPKINLQLLDQALIATPHIAGYSFDGKIKGTEMIYQKCCDFFKKQPQWSLDKVKCKELPHLVDFQDISSSMLASYDILEDDQRLRKIISLEKSKCHIYFDELRKNYPIRREWRL